jgi:protein-disulfide isomerase
MTVKLEHVANVALIVASVTVVAHTVLLQTRGANGDTSRVSAAESATDFEINLPERLPASAAPKAEVVLLEFSDFECVFCAKFANDTFKRLEETYIRPGKIAHVQMHLPNEATHRGAFLAAEALECARDRGRAAEMGQRLFAQRDKLARPDLLAHAESLGLSSADFDQCLQAGKAEIVRKDMELGKRFGIQGTPTFLIGQRLPSGAIRVVRRINGARDFDVFRTVLDDVLKRTHTS